MITGQIKGTFYRATHMHSTAYTTARCLSVTRRCSFETHEQVDLFVTRRELHSADHTHCVIRESRYLQNKRTLSQTLNSVDCFLLFRLSASTVVSAVNWLRPSQVYDTERPSLFATRWPTMRLCLANRGCGWPSCIAYLQVRQMSRRNHHG